MLSKLDSLESLIMVWMVWIKNTFFFLRYIDGKKGGGGKERHFRMKKIDIFLPRGGGGGDKFRVKGQIS